MRSPADEATPATTLVVVFRRPAPGHGKQRLAAELGAAETCAIAGLLLDTALEDAAAWAGPLILAPADRADADWARDLVARAAQVIPQVPGNLGLRLSALDQAARNAGHGTLLYIGSDAPILGPGDYAAAIRALGDRDVALQPARDGGVTLMGSRRPWPALADLRWGTTWLHRDLDARCRSAGRSVATLPLRYDVDVHADLARLARDLASDPRPARRALFRKLAGLGYAGDSNQDAGPP